MSILYKYSEIHDNLHEENDKKESVRPIALSRQTLTQEDFVEFLSRRKGNDKGEMSKAVLTVFEGIKEVLKEGNILNIKNFGSFSLTARFREDREADEKLRAESIKVKNVVFKAASSLKNEITSEGFERYNPALHNKRKY